MSNNKSKDNKLKCELAQPLITSSSINSSWNFTYARKWRTITAQN